MWKGKKIRRFVTVRWLRFFRKRFRWMVVPHLRLGRLGEWLSCRALEELGVEVLCRNVRNHYGEIDIVARDGIVLCFVEVKTRHRQEIGRPSDAVDETRRRRQSRAAAQYRKQLGDHVEVAYRFDIMEVIFDGWKLSEINYLKNAYRDRTVRDGNVSR